MTKEYEISSPTLMRAGVMENNDHSKSETDPQSCLGQKVEPKCLRSAYGLNKYVASNTTSVSQAVIVNNYYKPSDLSSFERKYFLPNQNVVVNNVVSYHPELLRTRKLLLIFSTSLLPDRTYQPHGFISMVHRRPIRFKNGWTGQLVLLILLYLKFIPSV